MTNPTSVTLVTGNVAGAREAAIAAILIDTTAINSYCATSTAAIILEGMPDGSDPFATIASNLAPLSIARIAPGCPCCIGNLTMRVTLNRILRHPPQRLYISVAMHAHIDQLREFLMSTPYNKLLTLTKDIHV